MKITVLTENTACRPDILPEHGLSLYIETDTLHILFDMGQTDLLLQNAGTLGIDLSRVDIAILSHGHYDHGGGFAAFRQVNRRAPLYVSPHAFGDFYSTKYIGLPQDVQNDLQTVPVVGTLPIAKGVTLYADLPIPCDPTVGKGLYRRENGKPTPDYFDHEIYLMIEENGKKVLFCGCSHKGALPISQYFAPDFFIGGFHLKNLSPIADKEYLTRLAAGLLSQSATYHTCHCTGEEPYAFLKAHMQDRLHYLSAGMSLTL